MVGVWFGERYKPDADVPDEVVVMVATKSRGKFGPAAGAGAWLSTGPQRQ